MTQVNMARIEPIKIALRLVVVLLAGLLASCSGAVDPGAGGAMPLAFTDNGISSEPAVSRNPEIIDNPTVADLAKAGPLGDLAFGSANAPVTVIEYASLTCPFCKAFHERTYQAFKRRYIDTGKVRYIVREFPIGHSSGNAWLVTRCAPKKDFLKLYGLYLQNQHLWVSQNVRPERIFAIAKRTGMTRAAFDKCMSNQAIIDAVKWVKQRGRRLGVTGTPTFFINGRKERSALTIEQLAGIIDPMIEARVASGGAS